LQENAINLSIQIGQLYDTARRLRNPIGRCGSYWHV